MSFRPIVGTPRLLQDWGTEQHERETHWTSLFYDLMVVAALNAIAEPFEEGEEEEEGERRLTTGLFLFIPIQHLWLNALLQFASVINSWNFLNHFTSMFEDETLVGHLAFFVHAFGLAATTAGCVGKLEENYLSLAIGNILAKIGMLVLHSRPMCYLPRARTHMSIRSFSFVVSIGIVLYGMQFPFQTFRIILLVATIWDWLSLFLVLFIKKEERRPLHIQSFSDRVKEVTMVIFGEAIFAIILKPYSDAKPQTHYYFALASTLWVIYSMALQEFHIMPNEHDHALRRSVMFGFLWYYTQFFKQFCLLGTSIGIKRAHLLLFKQPLEPIDRDTRRLIVWGLSLTMLSTVMIRSYSFGFGRHPNKHDPKEIYWLKVAWWFIMVVGAACPQLLDFVVFEYISARPVVVLVVFGCLNGVVIMAEAALSNLVASRSRELGRLDPHETTYLASSHASGAQTYGDHNEEGGGHGGETDHENQEFVFPCALAPKKEHS